MIYVGKLEFRRPLRVASGADAGAIEVTCELGYQACDPFACELPTKADLRANGNIVAIGPEKR